MTKPPDDSDSDARAPRRKKTTGTGLKTPKRVPAVPRPGRAASRRPQVAPPSRREPAIEIEDRRALAAKQPEIAARVNANPELAAMLFINPVLALEAFGVKLSKDVAHHVLHRMQHPKMLRERRESLEKQLAKALGEAPRPNDGEWVAQALFEKLSLAPLATDGKLPEYVAALDAAHLRRLSKLRPKPRRRYPQPRRLRRKASVASAGWTPAVRRIDLAKPAPEVEQAATKPRSVSVEALYFYKDQHEVAKSLLELAIIQRQGFPFHTPDTFRKIQEGTRSNAFRSWIRAVRLPEIDS